MRVVESGVENRLTIPRTWTLGGRRSSGGALEEGGFAAAEGWPTGMSIRPLRVLAPVMPIVLGLALGTCAAWADSAVGTGDDSLAAAIEAIRAGRTLEAAERLLVRLPGDRDAAILLGRIVLEGDLDGSYRRQARRALEDAVARSDDDRLAAFILAELLTSSVVTDGERETARDLYRRAAALGLTEALGRLLQPALRDTMSTGERAGILDRVLQRSARADDGPILSNALLADFATDDGPTGRWQAVAFAAHAGHPFWRTGAADRAALFNHRVQFDGRSALVGDHLCSHTTFVDGLPVPGSLVTGTVGPTGPVAIGAVSPEARVLHVVCNGRAFLPVILTGTDEMLLPVDGGVLVLWPRPDARILDVQRLLGAEGYLAGPADGYYGPLTREAVIQRERDLGRPGVGDARAVAGG